MKVSMLVALAIGTLAWTMPAQAQEPSSVQAPGNAFVGAETCATCHEKIFQAWSATKHARTINRLGRDDKQSGKCSYCHATGTVEALAVEGDRPKFPNVQCEACHGMGKLHTDTVATNSPAAIGIVSKPEEDTCTKCHGPASPHYRGFFYEGMRVFVHQVK